MTLILSATVFTGTSFAADKKAACQADCSCTSSQREAKENVFEPLFPEYEVQPRIEG